jgi:hypothetical protein
MMLATNKKIGFQTDRMIFWGSFKQLKENIQNLSHRFFPGHGHLVSMQAISKNLARLGNMLGSLTKIFPKFMIIHFSKFRNLF